MDYDTVVKLALSYSDREDDEVIDRIDDFIEIVEARVNRALRVFDMSIRAELAVVAEQQYYGLPSDFGGLRDIELVSAEGASRITMKYMSPEQMNQRQTSQQFSSPGQQVWYTLVAKQLQIYPPQDTGDIEIIYYQRLIPLAENNPSNWLSDRSPDCYIFGILVEISSFVKNAEGSALWDGRFKSTLKEIEFEDSNDRWSGTALETRLG